MVWKRLFPLAFFQANITEDVFLNGSVMESLYVVFVWQAFEQTVEGQGFQTAC